MGGNTTNRIHYSKQVVEQWVMEWKKSSNPLYNPVTRKIYPNYKLWKYVFSTKVSNISSNYFFYLLEPPHYSKLSGKRLTEEEFSFSSGYKKWVGWKSYTLQEIKNRDYARGKRDKKIGKKIRKKLKEFYSTEKGKEVRRKQVIKAQPTRNEFYKTSKGKEVKKQASEKTSKILREKIKKGEFTPYVTNTWTHWTVHVNDTRYRSTWEACFHVSFPFLEYESIRIPYYDNKRNKHRTYIADFYNPRTNTIIELKPKSRWGVEIDKMNSIIRYCKTNNINFLWINEETLIDYINITECRKKCSQHLSKVLKISPSKKITNYTYEKVKNYIY